MSTSMNWPDAVGNPSGASRLVDALRVSAIFCVAPVALSNVSQVAR